MWKHRQKMLELTRWTVAWVVVLSGLGRTVHAQITDPAAAEALFREGRRLLKDKDGDVAAACAKFDESLRLDPAIGTLINVAACQERLGRTATAWQHWRAAADQLATTDRRRTMAIAHATALEKVLSRLIVTLGPNVADDEQVEVRRDGITLGRASLGLPLPLDPGPHLVTVRAPGRQPLRYELMIRPGETRTLLLARGPEEPAQLPERQTAEVSPPGIPPGPAPASPPSVPSLGMQTPASPPAARWTTVAGWGLIGAGAVAAGMAGYFGFQALEARRDAEASCPGPAADPVCFRSGTSALDRDRRFSLTGDVAVAVGALLVGGGLYLLHGRLAEPSGRAGVVAKF
jgi:hypothetical protein